MANTFVPTLKRQKDGTACPFCGWLVRCIQDDGTVRMEHDWKCRWHPRNQLLKIKSYRSKE